MAQIILLPDWNRGQVLGGDSTIPLLGGDFLTRCIENSKFVTWYIKQPPESPFSKGDLKNSPLIKGARGLFALNNYCISKKVAAKGSPI
ncbi:MAG: hypothetical protein A3J92_02925 [Planctomycetes bacterium RIFOXYC2_FULL_41_27]|nr:MAG: hypothetical protein A3J92_02925 [Planctomycetes bacterium RIFOXYC2_FULL_41_27]